MERKSAHRGRPPAVFATKLVEHEERQLRAVDAERDKVMDLALEHYMLALNKGAALRHDLAIFRFVALWFDGKESRPGPVEEIVRLSSSEIRSDKFLALLPQMAAHLAPYTGAEPDLLQTVIGN